MANALSQKKMLINISTVGRIPRMVALEHANK